MSGIKNADKNGLLDRRYDEDSYNPIMDGDAEGIGITLFLTDITSRKRAEE